MIIRDGNWTLFDYDIKTGRQVWRTTNDDGSETYRTDYPVQEVLDENHAARMESHGERYGDWRRVASVPLNLHYDQLADAQSQRDSGYIDRWLRENPAFKTFR